jgi:FAD/FMN-containing dehydrogenase
MMTAIASNPATAPGAGPVAELAGRLRGDLLQPSDTGYDQARTVWNAMIDRRPALIARCAGTDDVVAAVNFAREQGLLVSVRGGGHNVAGNAVCDDGLMIDLSPMKDIVVDPEARTVRAGGGVLWGEFDAATQAHGLATTGGTVADTGIAGLTLGGGIGYLMRRFGLASDNLISVEIVTADGQVRTASATEQPDLFWALRGGGGNFGVVTNLEYRLHEVGPTVLGGVIIHPFERAREVFQFFREFAPQQPDEFMAFVGLLTGEDGKPAVALIVCWSGHLDEGERVLAPLRNFGLPAADLVAPIPYTAVQGMFATAYPPGRRNYWKASFLDELGDEAIDTLIATFRDVPSPLSAAACGHYGGAVGRIGADVTAFSQRDAAFDLNITSEWTDPAGDDANIGWARGLWHAMQPFVREAGYVNYLSAGEQDRVAAAYGPHYERLVALKTTYDPDNLFRMNQNIKPAAGSRS